MERRRQVLEREDWRAALICSVLANIHRDTKKRAAPFEPGDFLPGRRSAGPRVMSDAEMAKRVEWINRSLGGQDLRHG